MKKPTIKIFRTKKIKAEEIVTRCYNKTKTIEAIKEYAKEKCKKQRKLCYKNCNWSDVALNGEKELFNSIKNAPEPEFD